MNSNWPNRKKIPEFVRKVVREGVAAEPPGRRNCRASLLQSVLLIFYLIMNYQGTYPSKRISRNCLTILKGFFNIDQSKPNHEFHKVRTEKMKGRKTTIRKLHRTEG